MSTSSFSRKFLWGASTSSHQVEGHTYNQWTVWENNNAPRLAEDSKDATSNLNKTGYAINWSSIEQNASMASNYISGEADDHYKLFNEDFKLLKSLNLNSFRFSIEWSRLQPEEDQWNQEAINHYHNYINSLIELNIEPIITIWHWTMPVWFANYGGFERKSNLKYFYNYVKKVSFEYGSKIKYIAILNEPNVYTGMSYMVGQWPPQKKSTTLALLKVYRHLAIAHRQSYKIIKKDYKNIMVGIAMSLTYTLPASTHNPINLLAIKLKDYAWNWWFLNKNKNFLDFIGVNYYMTDYLNWHYKIKSPKSPVSDLGWYMQPADIYYVIKETWQRYKLPIIITENGVADAKDQYRQWWIEETIKALTKNIDEGVNLLGYLHWSLLDNFEWAFGWWPKFGLIAVDRQTMKRTIKESAVWFSQKVKRLSTND